MIRAVLEIARHELYVALRTTRAVWVAALYLFAAVASGVGVILFVRSAEQTVIQTLIKQGMTADTAAQSLDVMSDQFYQQLFSWFAGSAGETVAESLQVSILHPFLLWTSLAFLPFLILLTSFDQVAADLESRSICYSVLRVRRTSLLFGKLLAQATLFLAVTAIGSVALALLAMLLLESFSLMPAVPGLFRIWLMMIPFGLCYLAISAFCSSMVRSPFAALLAAIGLVVSLRVVGWFGVVPADSSVGLLRHLEWLSPATYQDGLWLSSLGGPLGSSAAYLGFAVIFIAGATFNLGRRDL